jgi:hypothetical protein
MNKDLLDNFAMSIWLIVLGFCTCVMFLKLTYDFATAPNVFSKKEETVKLDQKEIDSMCVKWWSESDLTAAKKRVCGK